MQMHVWLTGKLTEHWAILGAGSIGCLWAAYLCKTNIPFTLLLKNQATQKIWQEQKGLCLELGEHVEQLGANINTRSVEELFNKNPITLKQVAVEDRASIDFLIVTTKAHQTKDAILSITSLLKHTTTILLMQNGLGVYEELRTALPDTDVFCASTTEGAYQKKRFHVVHAGQGNTFLGAFETTNSNPELLTSIQEVLSATGLKVDIDSQIQRRLWDKLAINCAINGLTVIHQCQNGKLLDLPKTVTRMKMICEEVASVMLKKGISSNEIPVTGASLFETVEKVAIATQHNYSSMLQDFTHQRPTEINYINGYLLRQADELNLHCPYNIELLEQVNQLTHY